MGLNLVDNTNYGFVGEKVGTFTPNFTPASGSHLNVKQIGNIVYLSGVLIIDGTWADITNNHLGDITGVDYPAMFSNMPVISYSDNLNDLHNGNIAMAHGGNNSTYIGKNLTGTDKVLAVNGFYFTA